MSSKIASKIVEVMKKIDYLQKDGQVTYGKTRYSYLSEEKITTSIRQALIEVGLTIYPVKMEVIGEREVATKSGASTVLNILATYRIQDAESEDFIEVQALGEGMDSGDKAAYKAMTGAFKYAQRHTFAIPTGDDPDKTSSDELIGESSRRPKAAEAATEGNGNGANFQSFWANAKNLGYTEEQVRQAAGVGSLKGFSQTQLNSLLLKLRNMKQPKAKNA